MGRVSEGAKVKLLGNSWVFAYPSTMEGWGISALEANACGTPVIASNVPGLRDSVHNPKSGILVEKGNVQAYKEMIGLLLTNKNLRRQFEKNSLDWAKKFSWHTSADDFLNVIKNELKKINHP